MWHKDSPQALAMRERLKHNTAPELADNAMLCAVNQATYLLKRQIESQKCVFLEKGGFCENLYQQRIKARADLPDKKQESPE